MRDDIAPANIGQAPKEYDNTFFWRTYRDIEMFISKLLAKGPITVTDLTADSLTVAGNLTTTAGLVQIADGFDISSAADTSSSFRIGAYSTLNVMMDSNEMQAASNGVASGWAINPFGGTVALSALGSVTVVRGTFNVDDAATFDTTVDITGTLDVTGAITGTLATFSGTFLINQNNSVTLSSTTHGFQLGATASSNLRADANSIQAAINGATGGLAINQFGGAVTIGLADSTDATTLNQLVHIDTVLRILRQTSLTIATGVITVTGSHHAVETQALAATDDLDTINGGTDGHILIIRPVSSTRTVVVKNGTGNIVFRDALDRSLGSTSHGVLLVYNGAVWMGGL